MGFEKFDIYFSGEILPGHNPAKVRQTAAQLFKIDAAQVERLFSGARLRIKRGVDADTAGNYRATLRKAGILIEIETTVAQSGNRPSIEESDQERPPLTGLEVSEDDSIFELLPANTGTLEDCAPPPAKPPSVNIEGVTLAAAGSLLDDSAPPPAPNIDVSNLSAASPNTGSLEDCVDHKDPYPIPDISRIDLSE